MLPVWGENMPLVQRSCKEVYVKVGYSTENILKLILKDFTWIASLTFEPDLNTKSWTSS